MENIQSLPKPEMQQKQTKKSKRETQLIGYVVQGYQIKEKKKVKVNWLEKEVTVIKDLVISSDESPKNQSIVNNSWDFITK